MKIILFLTVILTGLLALGGCTRNDGDIGDLFGTWQVESITTVEGVPGVALSDGQQLTFAFQGNTMNIRSTDLDKPSYVDLAWARFERNGNDISAHFTGIKDWEKERLQAATGIIAADELTIHIESLTARTASLTIPADDNTLQISLKKIP